jgi:hypothetical protein
MKEYWQIDFYADNIKKTRYLYGTEAAANRRFKKYKYENKELRKISKSKAEYLKQEKKVHIIDL